jgi:hypothetical protein
MPPNKPLEPRAPQRRSRLNAKDVGWSSCRPQHQSRVEKFSYRLDSSAITWQVRMRWSPPGNSWRGFGAAPGDLRCARDPVESIGFRKLR